MARDIEISPSGKTLLWLIGALVVFGLVMLSSAGIVEGTRKFDAPYHFLWHQIFNGVLPGIVALYVLSKIKYDTWKKFALPILILAVILMIAVFIPSLSTTLKGASRWIELGPITFQPSESLKLALVVYLAAWFSTRDKRIMDWKYSLVPFLLVLGFVALLLILQPDFGTLGLVMLIGMAIYFFSGAQWKHLIVIAIIGGLLLGSLALVSPYRFNRIKTFINPTEDTLGTSYHITQAKIAIGSGGIFGVGFGASQQKHKYLPEVVGDSIFAVLVEELGLVGGLFLIALLLALLLTLLKIATQAPDEFGRLFVLGVAVWVVGQAFINIGAISGVIPLTGLPLPFMSFGSSSLVTIMAAMGICVNVSRQ